jgi:hypothetical protein
MRPGQLPPDIDIQKHVGPHSHGHYEYFLRPFDPQAQETWTESPRHASIEQQSATGKSINDEAVSKAMRRNRGSSLLGAEHHCVLW